MGRDDLTLFAEQSFEIRGAATPSIDHLFQRGDAHVPLFFTAGGEAFRITSFGLVFRPGAYFETTSAGALVLGSKKSSSALVFVMRVS